MKKILTAILILISPLSLSEPSQVTTQADKLQRQLIIYRPGQKLNVKSIYFRISLDNKKLGKLKNNRIMSYPLTAGTHHLSANDKQHSAITLNNAHNQTVVVKASVEKKEYYRMRFEEVSLATLEKESPDLWKKLTL